MAINTSSTVVSVFETRALAESAIDELVHAGFRQEDIGFVTREGHVVKADTPTERREEIAADGAVAGAISGAAAGAVAGALASILLPGVGLVIGGGLLIGALGGAAAGAALGTYLGPFLAMGFTEKEARCFDEEVKSGRTLVVVRAADRTHEAQNIIAMFGGHDAGADMVVGGRT